jgi:hypothetical protein
VARNSQGLQQHIMTFSPSSMRSSSTGKFYFFGADRAVTPLLLQRIFFVISAFNFIDTIPVLAETARDARRRCPSFDGLNYETEL